MGNDFLKFKGWERRESREEREWKTGMFLLGRAEAVWFFSLQWKKDGVF
ncbi:hypothetical protein HMPREF1548_05216 [Clostridium sp. KLE 1755]|nr:hypothetical protein HMPREF1548_05216 [Clostridium sp. KLE 1755]